MNNTLRTGMLLAAMTALFAMVGFAIAGATGAFMALIFAAVMNFITYWNADKIVLKMYKAQPVKGGEVYDLVQQLAANAGLPMPKFYVIPTDQPNAFATGRNPENAAVAVTKGIVNVLTPDELGGVIAHELAHIKNRDTLTMTMTATLAGAISALGNMLTFSSMRSSNENRVAGLGALAAIILAPFAAMLVQMAISRTREYSADAVGAEICGNPLALASALRKISAAAKHVPNPIAERNPSSAQLHIINPLAGINMDNLFSTHPSTANRIAALEAMAKNGVKSAARKGKSGPITRY